MSEPKHDNVLRACAIVVTAVVGIGGPFWGANVNANIAGMRSDVRSLAKSHDRVANEVESQGESVHGIDKRLTTIEAVLSIEKRGE